MWSQPWGYREAFAIPSGLLLLGIISHFALGVIPDYAFSYPQNLIGGLLLTALSVAVDYWPSGMLLLVFSVPIKPPSVV